MVTPRITNSSPHPPGFTTQIRALLVLMITIFQVQAVLTILQARFLRRVVGTDLVGRLGVVP